jgi:esterase
MLHFQVAGKGEPLVLLHGLFGSLENLGAIARLLSAQFKVYSVDLPNHGRSAHRTGAGLEYMAETVWQWMEQAGLGRAAIVGHSLGGKVAMEVALAHPDRVAGLVVIDIAPVAYPPRHQDIFAGLNAIEPTTLASRAEAETQLSAYVQDTAVRNFLLKNLVRRDNRFTWRMDLEDLQREYPNLIDENRADAAFGAPVLFLKGGASDYIRADHHQAITRRFPAAQYKVIANAGHWLHAEKPELVATLIRKFLCGLPPGQFEGI